MGRQGAFFGKYVLLVQLEVDPHPRQLPEYATAE